MEKQEVTTKPAFAKFRHVCKQHDIGATSGYELVAAKLLHVFKIGSGTYIQLSEFDELPERLKDPAARARLAEVKRNGVRAAV